MTPPEARGVRGLRVLRTAVRASGTRAVVVTTAISALVHAVVLGVCIGVLGWMVAAADPQSSADVPATVAAMWLTVMLASLLGTVQRGCVVAIADDPDARVLPRVLRRGGALGALGLTLGGIVGAGLVAAILAVALVDDTAGVVLGACFLIAAWLASKWLVGLVLTRIVTTDEGIGAAMRSSGMLLAGGRLALFARRVAIPLAALTALALLETALVWIIVAARSDLVDLVLVPVVLLAPPATLAFVITLDALVDALVHEQASSVDADAVARAFE